MEQVLQQIYMYMYHNVNIVQVLKKTGYLNLATTRGRLTVLRRQQAVGR